MTQHFTRATIAADGWCKRCWRMTPHRIDDRRLGPCLVCLSKPVEPQKTRPEPTKQIDLFGHKPPTADN